VPFGLFQKMDFLQISKMPLFENQIRTLYKTQKAAQLVPLFSFGIILENLIRLYQSVNAG
jgi:hypothetical protein